MSKLNMVRRCFACGAILQDDNPSFDGYINSELLEKSPNRVLLCNKCYREKNIDNSQKENKIDSDILTMLKDAEARDALIVLVMDFINLESTLVDEFTNLIQGDKVLAIVNKKDLLPKEIDEANLKEYISNKLKISGLKPIDIIFSSTSDIDNVKKILDSILKYRNAHDVYLFGSKGSGKSILLSKLLTVFENTSKKMIVTDVYPKTSARVMKLPLDNSSYIYDTIGLPIDNSITSKIDKDSQKIVTIKKPLKKNEVPLYYRQSLCLGGLVRIDQLSEKKEILNFYISPEIEIKRITSYTPDKVFFKWIDKKQMSPVSENLKSITDFDILDIVVEEDDIREISIQGLGWFSFKGNKQHFRIYVPKGIKIYYSRSKL